MNSFAEVWKVSIRALLCLVLATHVLWADDNRQIKDWNFQVWMCNNNNLHRYGVQNFYQMLHVGSTPAMNVLLQMDEYGTHSSVRFFIDHNNPVPVQTLSGTASSYSGTPANLYEFAAWSMGNYIVGKQCLVLWNHGAGIKDPDIWGRVIGRFRDEFYVFNKNNGLLELNRKLVHDKKWLEHLQRLSKERGIAFNDTAEVYLTNQDLKMALEKIAINLLSGKKIDVLAMDACHMAMIEVAAQIKNAVQIMVASQEVEPGMGYDYAPVLNPRTFGSHISAVDFAKHIVSTYANQYRHSMSDYTQSAVDLAHIDPLMEQINILSGLLTQVLSIGHGGVKVIKDIRFSSELTTQFLDNDYIDLYHFFESLQLKSNEFSKLADERGRLWREIGVVVHSAMNVHKAAVIANAVGVNLPNAHGLSIYFPTRAIHASYYKTVFASCVANWPAFLAKFLEGRKLEASTKSIDEHHDGDACCKECEEGKPCASEATAKHGHAEQDGKPCCQSCADGKECEDEKPAKNGKKKGKKQKQAKPKPTVKRKGCKSCKQIHKARMERKKKESAARIRPVR